MRGRAAVRPSPTKDGSPPCVLRRWMSAQFFCHWTQRYLRGKRARQRPDVAAALYADGSVSRPVCTWDARLAPGSAAASMGVYATGHVYLPGFVRTTFATLVSKKLGARRKRPDGEGAHRSLPFDRCRA